METPSLGERGITFDYFDEEKRPELIDHANFVLRWSSNHDRRWQIIDYCIYHKDWLLPLTDRLLRDFLLLIDNETVRVGLIRHLTELGDPREALVLDMDSGIKDVMRLFDDPIHRAKAMSLLLKYVVSFRGTVHSAEKNIADILCMMGNSASTTECAHSIFLHSWEVGFSFESRELLKHVVKNFSVAGGYLLDWQQTFFAYLNRLLNAKPRARATKTRGRPKGRAAPLSVSAGKPAGAKKVNGVSMEWRVQSLYEQIANHDDTVCVVCLRNPPDVIYLPCRHVPCCQRCHAFVDKTIGCMWCRGVVKKIIKDLNAAEEQRLCAE